MRTTIYQPGRTPNNWELFIPPIKMVMTGRWCKKDIVLPISLYLHTILHIPYICIKQHYTIYIYHLYTYITVYPINIYIHTAYNCSSISHVALPISLVPRSSATATTVASAPWNCSALAPAKDGISDGDFG